jgi:hypothetical protein
MISASRYIILIPLVKCNAIYENNFELAKILIDCGKVHVNIKNNCGDTPLIATCQQTTFQTEEEAVKFIHYLWQSDSKFKKSNKQIHHFDTVSEVYLVVSVAVCNTNCSLMFHLPQYIRLSVYI